METPGKPLHLILYMVEGNKSRTVVDDTLGYQPDYRVGDVIHFLQPTNRYQVSGDDHQYIVRRIKHIVHVGEANANAPTYSLLVEVVELLPPERDEFISPLEAIATGRENVMEPGSK